MRTDNDSEALLTLWERVLRQPASTRDDALLQAWFENAEPVRCLGERNARLMALHARFFEPDIELLSHCPACNTVAQFSANCDALAAQMRPNLDAAPPYRLEVQRHVIEFRLPDSADIAMVFSEKGDRDLTQLLLDRCVLACTCEGIDVSVGQLPEAVLGALSQQMETLDPGASVSFTLDCPKCAMHWRAPLDVGEVLWQKVRTAAEGVLLDIDALARAYGWTEREVLRLNPLRRAAYLQMVTAER